MKKLILIGICILFALTAVMAADCRRGITITESKTLEEDYSHTNSPTRDFCFELAADNIIFDCNGHTIREAQNDPFMPIFPENYGIIINGKTNITIQNCTIRGFKEKISSENVNSLQILNSEFSLGRWSNLGPIISLTSNEGVLVSNNKIGGGWSGYQSIYADNSANLEISENGIVTSLITNSENVLIEDNENITREMRLEGVTNAVVRSNHFLKKFYARNSDNVLFEGNAGTFLADFETSTKVIVSNNRFRGSQEGSIILGESNLADSNVILAIGMGISSKSDCEITNNEIMRDWDTNHKYWGPGIYVNGWGVKIENNTLFNLSQPGIKIEGGGAEILSNGITGTQIFADQNRDIGILIRSKNLLIDGYETILPSNNIIKYNTIKDHVVGIDYDSYPNENEADYYNPADPKKRYMHQTKFGLFEDIIEHNNIYKNKLNMKTDVSVLAWEVSTDNNYWGSLDFMEILGGTKQFPGDFRQGMYDYKVDPRVGEIDFCTLLDQPYPEGQSTSCLNEEPKESEIKNEGNDPITGYLIIKIDQGIQGESDDQYIIDDLSANNPRTINPGQAFDLGGLFEEGGGVTATSWRSTISVSFVDENGLVLEDSYGGSFYKSFKFFAREPYADTNEPPVEIDLPELPGAPRTRGRTGTTGRTWVAKFFDTIINWLT